MRSRFPAGGVGVWLALAAWPVFAVPPAAMRLPLFFEQNHGQADPRYAYVARSAHFSLLLSGTEAILSFNNGESLRMLLVGARAHPEAQPLDPLPGRANYFTGSDPAAWVRNAPTSGRIRFLNVYRGIDVVYYGQGREFENDFVLAPGADPSRIRVSFAGARGITIDSAGDLVVSVSNGSVRWHKPLVYQELNGARREISGRYRLLDDHQVAFHVDRYDHGRPLVLDPTLTYSTYLGSTGNDNAQRVAVDSAGNAYIVGSTTNYPATAGAYQTPLPESHTDVLVAKISSAGRLLFATHIGGKREDVGLGIAVDSTGVYVAGGTSSSDFPVKGGFQSTLKGKTDAFVLKLSLAGDALIYSTYMGGSDMDGAAAIAVDSAGSAYVTGATCSTDFPVKSAFQSTFHGEKNVVGDAFIAKIDPTGSSLVYSTYFGGSADDAASAIAVDASGAVYVTGATISADFPTTKGAFQTTYGGAGGEMYPITGDAFVVKLNAAGQPVYSTYLGGSADDSGYSIAVDTAGNAYIAGTTFSSNFPTRQPQQAAYAGSGTANFFKWSAGDAFVAKLNAAGSDLIYSTYLGGRQDDRATGIVVDFAGNAWVTGHALSTDFPVTKDAYQSANHGGNQQFVVLSNGYVESPFGLGDAFVVELDGNGKLAYSTFLGGKDEDIGLGLALDSQGHLYVVGNTMSTDFPVTSNAAQAKFGGFTHGSLLFGDGFVAILQVPAAPTPAVLNLSAAASANSVAAGSSFSYTFTVKNNGPGAAANLKLSATISGAVQVASTSISTGSCASLTSSPPQLSCSAASLSESASTVLTIQAAAAVGSGQASVTLSWDNGTAQTVQSSVAVVPPAGSLQFAVPVTKSVAAGAPAAVALSARSVFLLTSNIEIYQNNPTAQARVNLTALPTVGLPQPASPVALLALDLNGDQRADLIVLDNAAGTVTTYLAGDAGYSIAQSFAANANATAMAALNLAGNGSADLVVIGDNGVALFTSNGDGIYTPAAAFDVAGRQGRLLAVAAGSFTGAGLDDLVLSDAGGNIWLLPSDGAGGFGTPTMAQAGANPSALAVGDVNGDMLLDVVVASRDSGNISLLLGDGMGNLAPSGNLNVGSGPRALAAVDFDGDGKLDLAVAVSGLNVVSLLRGDGAGGFQTPLPYLVGAAPVALAAGDVDGDGKPDLIVANSQSRDFSILVNQN